MNVQTLWYSLWFREKRQITQEKNTPPSCLLVSVFLAGAVQKMLKTDEKTIDPKALKVVHPVFPKRHRLTDFSKQGCVVDALD